jgi:hypothetical protein
MRPAVSEGHPGLQRNGCGVSGLRLRDVLPYVKSASPAMGNALSGTLHPSASLLGIGAVAAAGGLRTVGFLAPRQSTGHPLECISDTVSHVRPFHGSASHLVSATAALLEQRFSSDSVQGAHSRMASIRRGSRRWAELGSMTCPATNVVGNRIQVWAKYIPAMTAA